MLIRRSFFMLAPLLLLSQLHAGIIATTGAATVISAPASVAAGGNESNTQTWVFFERTLVLDSNVTVDNTATGAYPPNSSPGVTIGSGTAVSTYFFDFDPVGTSPTRTVDGSVTFDTDILGVLFTDSRLTATNASLGSPTTSYSGATEGLELGSTSTTDNFSISADRRQITFHFVAGTGQDQLRVLVEPVPEPGTMSLFALGAVGVLGLRRSVRNRR